MALSQIDILKKYKIPIEGKSGQHLLIDANVQKKIVDLLGCEENITVVEIGPGLGALTGEMIARGYQVIAIEKDERFIEILKDYFCDQIKAGQLKIIHEDVLKVDFFKLKKEHPALKRIISNLPYYITAPILIQTFEALPVFDRAVYMMQKEVGERVVANPGSSDYGRLSLNAYFSSDVECSFHVSPNCFTPQPKVWSSVLTFELKDKLDGTKIDRSLMMNLIKSAFGQRRKMLLSILSKSKMFGFAREEWEVFFQEFDISYQARAEELSPQKFVQMTSRIQEISSNKL